MENNAVIEKQIKSIRSLADSWLATMHKSQQLTVGTVDGELRRRREHYHLCQEDGGELALQERQGYLMLVKAFLWRVRDNPVSRSASRKKVWIWRFYGIPCSVTYPLMSLPHGKCNIELITLSNTKRLLFFMIRDAPTKYQYNLYFW